MIATLGASCRELLSSIQDLGIDAVIKDNITDVGLVKTLGDLVEAWSPTSNVDGQPCLNRADSL